MSEDCEVTGFSPQQIARWPNVHKQLCGQLELPLISEVSEEVILNIDEGIQAMLKSEGPNPKHLKARAGLFKHLKRTLEHRFKNATCNNLVHHNQGCHCKQATWTYASSLKDNPRKGTQANQSPA